MFLSRTTERRAISAPKAASLGTVQGGRDRVHVDEGPFEQAEPELDAQHPAHGPVDVGLVEQPAPEGLGDAVG